MFPTSSIAPATFDVGKNKTGTATAFDPLVNLDNIQLAILPHLSSTCFQDDFVTAADTDGQEVALLQSQGANYPVFTQTTSGREPVIGSDGTYNTFLDFGSGVGVRKFLATTISTGLANFLHNERTWSIAFPILSNADGSTQAILTTSRATGTEIGFTLNKSGANRLECFIQNGTTSSGKTTTATILNAQGWQVVILTCNAGALTIEIGVQAAETHTFTVNSSANSTSVLRFGSPGNTPASDSYLQSKIPWMIVTSDVLTDGEKSSLRAYNPTRTAAQPIRQVGQFDSLGFNCLSNCRTWYDFGDLSTVFQTTIEESVPIHSVGDRLGSVQNKARTVNSSSFNYNKAAAYDGTAATRPVYEDSSSLGSLKPYPVWDGKVNQDTGSVTNLLCAGTDDESQRGGSKTQIIVAMNRDNGQAVQCGSHYGRQLGSSYWVQTPKNYGGSADYTETRFVLHAGGETMTYGNESPTVTTEPMEGDNAWSMYVVRKNGATGKVRWNKRNSSRDPQALTAGIGFPTEIGEPVNANFWMCGPIAHWVEYSGELSDAQLAILEAGIEAELGRNLV